MITDQATSTTVRKVRWATVAAALATPIALLLAYLIEGLVPPGAVQMQALVATLEPAILMLLVAIPTWVTGYYVRAEIGEIGQ